MKKVLIVEDDLIIALSTQKMIRKLGHDVVGQVTTGEDAITKALEANPDIILMDIRLAGNMDGIEASTQILQSASDISIIYITGNTDASYRERAKETGCKGFLVKPVRVNELRNLFE